MEQILRSLTVFDNGKWIEAAQAGIVAWVGPDSQQLTCDGCKQDAGRSPADLATHLASCPDSAKVSQFGPNLIADRVADLTRDLRDALTVGDLKGWDRDYSALLRLVAVAVDHLGDVMHQVDQDVSQMEGPGWADVSAGTQKAARLLSLAWAELDGARHKASDVQASKPGSDPADLDDEAGM